MRILTIGRGEHCHIVYDNPTISRQHAILKIYPTGKMEITDQSTNGTSINGKPLRKGATTRVTRHDVVTFAGSEKLDWKDVPNPLKPLIIPAICVAVLALGVVAYYFIPNMFVNGAGSETDNGGSTNILVKDNDNKEKNNDSAADVDSLLGAGVKKESEIKRQQEETAKKKKEAFKKASILRDQASEKAKEASDAEKRAIASKAAAVNAETKEVAQAAADDAEAAAKDAEAAAAAAISASTEANKLVSVTSDAKKLATEAAQSADDADKSAKVARSAANEARKAANDIEDIIDLGIN